MKKLSRPTKMVICAVSGSALGLLIAAVLYSGWFELPINPDDFGFYIGLTLFVIGLFSILKGNANQGSMNHPDGGTGVYWQANIAIDEARSTKAMSSKYLQNHIISMNLFGVFTILAGFFAIAASILPRLWS